MVSVAGIGLADVLGAPPIPALGTPAPATGVIFPVGQSGPVSMTTVLGSGRLARLSRTGPRFRSIWRERPTHSSFRASKAYADGRIRLGRSIAFLSSLRSLVKPTRRRAPLSRR